MSALAQHNLVVADNKVILLIPEGMHSTEKHSKSKVASCKVEEIEKLHKLDENAEKLLHAICQESNEIEADSKQKKKDVLTGNTGSSDDQFSSSVNVLLFCGLIEKVDGVEDSCEFALSI